MTGIRPIDTKKDGLIPINRISPSPVSYTHLDVYKRQAGWPTYDEEAMKDDEVEIAVQINGKTRAVVTLAADVSKEDAIAKGKEAVADKLTGTIVKEIYVPGRIINIVQK